MASVYSFYTYRVELVGANVRISAQSPDKTEEPVGKFRLEGVRPLVSRLARKARGGTATVDELHQLGELLFEALFDDRLATHFREWLRKTISKDLEHESVLRLELDFDEAMSPDVAALPWEALRSPQQNDWPPINLATHPHLVISRRRKLWESAEAAEIKEKLRIQLVVANPKDLPEVQYDLIWQVLQTLATKRASLIELPVPVIELNLSKLDGALEGKPHILHFIGHGRIKKFNKSEKGQLALVDSMGYSNWISDAEFAKRFELYQPSLVFLQACESNATSTRVPFVGVASKLIHQNIPVVVGMQFPVSNVVAVSLATTFYTELIDELKPLDVALQEGRRRLEIEFGESANVLTPVLSSRLRPGPLFLLSDKSNGTIAHKFSETIFKDYPYPIAYACDEFNKASQAMAKFLRLNIVLVNAIKYLCAIALAHRHFGVENQELFRKQLGTLSHPTLESWVMLLGKVLNSWKKPPSIVADLLFKIYAAPIRTESPIFSAYLFIHRSYNGSIPAADASLTIRDFIEALVKYRESRWADQIDRVDEEFVVQSLTVLQPAIEEMLHFLLPLVEYPLCFIERIDMDGIYWIHAMIEFQGSSRPRLVEYRDEGTLGQPSVTPRRLYLCAPDKQPILDLRPFIVYIAAEKNALYFLDYNDENEDISYLPCGNGETYKPSPRFTTFMISAFNLENSNDTLDSLDEATSELDEINQLSEFSTPTLSTLLTSLDNESQQVLKRALGESLRIGRFWLGVEFLFMALSRPESGSALPELLDEMGLSAGDFRGMLRGMIGIVTRNDWRQIDPMVLGTNGYASLGNIDLELLRNKYWSPDSISPMITPRLLTILRELFNRKGDDSISSNYLLLDSLMFHNQCMPTQHFFQVAYELGWEAEQLLSWILDREKQEPKAWINDVGVSHRILEMQHKRGRRSRLILEALNGPLDGALFNVTSGTEWGAKVDGSLSFPWDLELGEKQARFFSQRKLWWIESIPSRHGTYRINDGKFERVTGKVLLKDKDVLKASNSWFLVHLE